MEDEEGIRALVEAPLDVAVDVLRVVLRHDADRVVGLLADSPAARADALVQALALDAEWLAPLSEAIRKIHHCQDTMGWIPDDKSTPMSRANPSKQGTTGFVRRYDQGNIHWCRAGGAQATTGEIHASHARHGDSGGLLGFPLSEELTIEDGSFQRFEGQGRYAEETCTAIGLRCGATVYHSSRGPFVTWAGIGDLYESQGGPEWFGFPTSEERVVGPSSRWTVGRIQAFEDGVVVHCDDWGAIIIEEEIAHYHAAVGGFTGMLGFPVSPPKTAGDSPAGTGGRYQRFEHKVDLPPDILAMWASYNLEAAGGATVYSSDLGIFAVASSIAELYERLGGTTSWLGFPMEDEHTDHELCGPKWVGRQRFEGGVVFRHEVHQAVAVSATIMAALETDPVLRRTLGYPRSPESSTGIDGMTVQLFDGGVVTVQNGTPALFVRPH